MNAARTQPTSPTAAPAHTSPVINPSRISEVAGRVRVATARDVDIAVDAAALAQRAWAALDVEDRASRLEQIATRIESRASELAVTLAREVGTVMPLATGELTTAARLFRLMATHARTQLADPPEIVEEDARLLILRRPYGVVACIVPWNAPAVLAAQKVAPALAAGNAVVVKPSPLAPLTVTAMLEEAAEELPAGLLQVVNGGAEVGNALVESPRIAKVSFTGGGPTASVIMRAAAARLTAVHFELGGNDPAIVLDDADPAEAARGIVGSAFRRSGQICYAVKRVYVPRNRAEAFREACVAAAEDLRVGDALDPRSTMGPVNNSAQFGRVRLLAERARAAGRSVVEVGGRVQPDEWDRGYFLQPALVVDAEHNDEIVSVEQFGPVLPIVAYDTEQDAVAMANDTAYGLGASVWSSDIDRAIRTATRIESGISFVNAHVQSPLALREMPFGGVKQSGMGWENSSEGLSEYLQFHSVDAHLGQAR